jgi:peptidyl-prolyl cis-trans isomerase C
MKPVRIILALHISACLLISPSIAAPAAALPEVDGRPVVAKVNDEPITLEEVFTALETVHEEMADPGGAVARKDPSEIVERLINVRLVVQEARVIGLDEREEFLNSQREYRLLVLRNLLFAETLRKIAVPDEKRVDRRYREAIEEVRVRSLLIPEEADALAFEAALDEGRDFDAIADELVEAGKASQGDSDRFMPIAHLFTEVQEALLDMKPGDVSAAVEISMGWAMLKLLDERIPEDPEERERARTEVLTAQRQEAIRYRAESLKKRYVTIDRELMQDLDYDAGSSAIRAYLADTRVVAEVDGADPVSVAELTSALQKKFFHGADRAAEKGLLNNKAGEVLSEILDRRVVIREAERLKLDETPEYRRRMGEFEDGLLFSAFVAKVIEPDLKTDEAELRAYMQAHIDEYTYPGMYRLESLAFGDRADAQEALAKLRRGADLSWVRSNTPGQLPAGTDDSLLNLRGNLVVSAAIPDDVLALISGAEKGEYRFLEEPDGPYYVIFIRDIMPDSTRPFDDAKQDLAKAVYIEKREQAVADYASQLREASEIEIYAEGEALTQAILSDAGAEN